MMRLKLKKYGGFLIGLLVGSILMFTVCRHYNQEATSMLSSILHTANAGLRNTSAYELYEGMDSDVFRRHAICIHDELWPTARILFSVPVNDYIRKEMGGGSLTDEQISTVCLFLHRYCRHLHKVLYEEVLSEETIQLAVEGRWVINPVGSYVSAIPTLEELYQRLTTTSWGELLIADD